MKYKVIGWTYYENYEILDSNKTIGFAERNAIIDEIRKHKYLFSGWHHQESWDGVVPVLNDGKKRCFSQRGWGGLMAEAYGHLNDMDYANYTFRQSIASEDIKCADDCFFLEDHEPEIIENEHFDVDVNEGLFEIAKTKNPFYLEDIDELRYIDENDTITLHYNDESLTFIVKDINRNKKALNFKDHHLINGKYKVIVTHKPESERQKDKLPIFYTSSEAKDKFEECTSNYNFDLLLDLFENFEIGYLAEDSLNKKLKTMFKRFVNEYIEKPFDSSIVIKVLRYLEDFEFYKEVAYKTVNKDENILNTFINAHLDKDVNIDEDVLKAVKLIKKPNYSFAKVLLRAIELKPNNKSLRVRYYKQTHNTNLVGFPVIAGLDLYKHLRKADRRLIELNDYEKYGENTILKIIELLTYRNINVTPKSYSLNYPKIYEFQSSVIEDGIYKYQKYIKANFDLDNLLEKMMLHGIDCRCHEMDQYMDGERHAADYVYALDLLTDFKYNLKEKALAKHAKTYKYFEGCINKVYK